VGVCADSWLHTELPWQLRMGGKAAATASTALENRNQGLPCTGLVCPWIAIYAISSICAIYATMYPGGLGVFQN